ncbi:MAG: PEP-CTERM sorting domain-containing protein [bacterium]
MKKSQRLRILLFTILIVFAGISRANADSILYFNDYCFGTDQMGEALKALSGTHTATQVSTSSDFASLIATGDFDLGIMMIQDSWSDNYSDGIYALSNFVNNEGGRAIYTDWSMDNTYAALFDAQWTGAVNDGQITVTHPQMSNGISNPISIYSSGWGVFSMDVDGPELAAYFSNGAGAISIGNGQRSIVNGFLTDTFVDGGQGVQLYINQVGYLIETKPVPEPGTIFLLVSGCLGLIGIKRISLIC